MAFSRTHRTKEWLRDQIISILEFYHPDCLDVKNGGYIAQFDQQTGEIYDRESKHLVATARFTVNFAAGKMIGGPDWCAPSASKGVDSLLSVHRDEDQGGFYWLVKGTEPVELKRICYGHAFVLLALSRVHEAGIREVADEINDLYELIDDHFWESEYGLCKSEYDSAWDRVSNYRGQNANMHMCEAMIAAYEALGRDCFLERAMTIAKSLVVDLAASTDGLIWEHYNSQWEQDFNYNRTDPTHRFRPWGYQPGHLIEWAKLLGTLFRHTDAEWTIARARELFESAVDYGWDDEQGGLYYTFDRQGEPVVTDKRSWEIAEGIGAAAILNEQTGETRYLDWYDQFWSYAEANLINAKDRNWYSMVSETNVPNPRTSGIASEPDYHPIGACFEGLQSLH